MERTSALDRARQVLTLRESARLIRDPDARKAVEGVAGALAGELGRAMPKKQAAALLGVSVTALDRWVARGVIPVLRNTGSQRAAVDSETVLRLAIESRGLERGKPGVLAAAVRRLEARRASEHRIEEAMKLSHVLTSIAASGRGR